MSAQNLNAINYDNYYGWLIVPMKVNKKRKKQYFKENEKKQISLDDLTIQAKRMFGKDEYAIGGVWEIDQREVLKALTEDLQTENRLTVRVDKDSNQPLEFNFLSSWVFCFRSDIAFLCLGICAEKPIAITWLSDFGYLTPQSVVEYEGRDDNYSFRDKLLKWVEDEMGLTPFYMSEKKSLTGYEQHSEQLNRSDYFFADACIYNIKFQEDPFDDLEKIKRAVFNLHLGLTVDDKRTDNSEEDIAFVYAAKDMEVDVRDSTEKGGYHWGCCITSTTMNFIYGGVDTDDNALEFRLMEGLPLMIISLHQRYQCLQMTEKLYSFRKMSSVEKEQLRNEMMDFIAYGTLSSAAVSRWYNVKMIYNHLIRLMDTEAAIADVAKKLDILIKESEKRSQKKIDTIYYIISIFGAIAIQPSVKDLVVLIAPPIKTIASVVASIVTFVIAVVVYLFQR